jgi:hypothetical protein
VSYYEDLSLWPLAGELFKTLRAVGWIEQDHSFTRGEVTEKFFGELVQLLVQPWQPAVAAGLHRCALCRFTGGPGTVSYNGTSVSVGAANLFVPGDEFIYVAPSLIVHYVDAHEYCPPKEFIGAVSHCPPMRSMKYLHQIKTIGGAGLIGAKELI